jgi:hypothetical protein
MVGNEAEGINFTLYLKYNKLQFFLYLYYFLRSVTLRGLANTVKLLVAEKKYEKQFGLQTATIKKSNRSEYFHYQGAPYLPVLKILNDVLTITGNILFTDIGCGKGRALLVAEQCGFTRLSGVELDKDLINEAENNFKRSKFRNAGSQVILKHENALDYIYPDEPTVFFLFNPFNEAILEKVLERIIMLNSHECWFIYMNPRFQDPFEKNKMIKIKEFKTRFYTEAVLFKKQPQILS